MRKLINAVRNIKEVLSPGYGDRNVWIAGGAMAGISAGVVLGALAIGVGAGLGIAAAGASTALAVVGGVAAVAAVFVPEKPRMLLADIGVLLGGGAGGAFYSAAHPVRTAKIVTGAVRYAPEKLDLPDLRVISGLEAPSALSGMRLRDAFKLDTKKPWVDRKTRSHNAGMWL